MLNSTKTWQEEFEQEYWGKFGSTKTINDIKQFISDLRKRDMEALIEMLNEEKFIQVGNFNDEIAFDRKGYRVGFIAGVNTNQAIDKSKQLIKDYYEN